MHVTSTVKTTLVLAVFAFNGIGFAETADDLYAVAAGHYSATRWDLAIEEFQLFLMRYPDNQRFGDAQFFLAEAYLQNADYQNGVNAFQKFIVHNSNHRYAARGLFRWGEAAMFAGQTSDALRLLKQFSVENPDHALNEYALTYLGRISGRDQGDTNTQRQFLTQSVRDYPQGAMADEAHFRLGTLDYQDRRLDEALTHFAWVVQHRPNSKHHVASQYWLGITKMAAEDYADAAEKLLEVAAGYADHPLAKAAFFFAAESLRVQGVLDGAARTYRQCLQKTSTTKWDDAALIGLIEIELQNDNDTAVESLAKQFDARCPHSDKRSRVQYALGRSYLKRKRYDESFAEFQNALQALDGAKRSGALSNKLCFYSAVSQIALGNSDSALDWLKRIDLDLASNQFRSNVLAAQGTALAKLKQYEEAVPAFEKSIELQTRGPSRDRCFTRLIAAQTDAGDLSGAQESLKTFFHESSDQNAVYRATVAVAEAFFQKQSFLKSQFWFQELAESGAGEFQIRGLAGLGWTQFHLHQFDASASSFDQILQRAPLHERAAEASFMKARALEHTGKTDQAMLAFQSVYADYADSDYAVDAMFAHAKLLTDSLEREKSVALLKKIATDHPSYPRIDAVLYDWAWVLNDLKRADDAIAIFTRINLEHPRSSLWGDSTYRLAHHALQRKDLRRTSELLDQLLLKPTDDSILPHARFLAARVAIENQEWNQAAKILSTFEDEFPDHELTKSARFWQAEAHYGNRDLKLAKAKFDALRQDGVSSQTWAPIVELRVSQILVAEGKWDDARNIAARLLNDNEDFQLHYEAEFVLGRCYAGLAQFTKARKHYQAVLNDKDAQKSETAAIAQWMIGETFYHQKQYRSAIRAYLRVEILYDFPEWRAAALLQAAKCYEIVNQDAEALNLYDRLTTHYQDTTHARVAEARRKQLTIDRQQANHDPYTE